MLPDSPLSPVAPAFSPEIERDIRSLLATRLGREGTDEELRGYRQLLWAFAIAIRAIERESTTPPP